MEAVALSAIMDRVQPGAKLRLTFKQANGRPRPNNHGRGSKYFIDDNMVATLSYFGMMRGQNLIINEMDVMVVMAIVQSKYWDSDQNRAYTVGIPEGFDRQWFEQRLRDGLEKVEIL